MYIIHILGIRIGMPLVTQWYHILTEYKKYVLHEYYPYIGN